MGNKTLVRRDGSTVVVPEADAQRLLTLGYREQTPSQGLEADIGAGIEEFYTTPGQQIQTGIEGGLSGLSLGLTDLLGGEGESERARYNPGIRLGGELVGSLLPLAPGGLGKAMAYTPTGLLERGAVAAGEALGGGSKVINTLTRTSIEGAGIGAGSALTQAQLNGEPITAEAILAGMGWGTLFGGGLGALGAGVEAKMESRALRAMEKEEAKFANVGIEEAAQAERAQGRARVHGVLQDETRTVHKDAAHVEDYHYDRVRGAVMDANNTLKEVKQVVEDVKNPDFTALKMSQNKIYSQLTDNMNLAYVKPEAKGFIREFANAHLAGKEGKFDKMVGHLDKFKEYMAQIETKLGGPAFFSADKVIGQANDLIGLAKYRLDTSVKAAEQLAEMEATRGALNNFPKSAEEFVGMTEARVERLTAAVDNLTKMKAAELTSVQEAVKDAVLHMSDGLGVKLEGTPGRQLRGMWDILKEARSARAKEELKMAQEGNLLWKKADKASARAEKARQGGEVAKAESKGKSGSQRAMESAARYGVGSWAAQRMGTPGYILGSSLVSGLVGLKGAVLGTIADSAKKWVPKAARGLQKFGSRIEPLAQRIDGTEDQGRKDRESLMKARAKEIHDAAPVVRDTLFRAVQPLSMEHPELAVQMHMQGVARFQYLLSKLPKDPGLAFSNLKSLWKPDPVAVEKFARIYEVFQNPVGVMNRALRTGKITAEAAEGLKEMNPELWTTLRSHLLERISDPEVQGKMKYEDQVQMGLILGIQLHSTMNPQFISAQQQMYTERNQPLEMNPRIQPGGGAGRPSGQGPGATSAQKITEH